MDWITDRIAIGNYRDAQDGARLRAEDVQVVLGLVPTLADVDTEELGVDGIEILDGVDGPGNNPYALERAIEILDSLLDGSDRVLVHCHAGRSRSAVVVAGYRVRTRGLSPHDALAAVAARRQIQVTPALVDLLNAL